MTTTVATNADQSRTTDTGADQAAQTDSIWHQGIDFARYDTIEYVQGSSDHFDDVGVMHRLRIVKRWAVEMAFERCILTASILERGCDYTVKDLIDHPCLWLALRPHARREIERGLRYLADIGALPVRRVKSDLNGVKRYRIL